jgi:vacuolar-type H+-ATPase subunit I/STV1
MSVPSEEALRQLGELDKVLSGVEQRVEQLSRLADEQAQLTPESTARLKTNLAQLEAEAHKLETNGVDGIYTSELKSGQVFAKESKKSQLRRLEKLFGVIEGIFHKLNAATLTGSM